MDDEDDFLHPLDILNAYALAGSFIEQRIARLKKGAGAHHQELELSRVLAEGVAWAVKEVEAGAVLVTADTKTAPVLSE